MTRTPPQLPNDELAWQQKLAEITISQFPGERLFEIAADWLRAEVEARLNGGHLSTEEDAKWMREWRQARAELFA